MNKHIIFIGFKHVGKSSIAVKLAEKLHQKFVDLDTETEILGQAKFLKQLSCRNIMHIYGEDVFRCLESEALHNIINSAPSLIALGGGTLFCIKNQNLIKSHYIIHVTGRPGTIFERIIINGRPAFFPPKKDSLTSFKKLWYERDKIYQSFRSLLIENDDSIESSVKKIMEKLSELKIMYCTYDNYRKN